MSAKKDLVRIIRKLQTFTAIFLFIIVFLFSWNVTGFEITEIQLSKWGETGPVAIVWNSIICLLAISIAINSFLYIKHTPRIKKKKISYVLFGFIAFCLLMVGVFNVNFKIIHNIAAYLYFFAYPLAIFVFTHIHRADMQYKNWVKNISISVGMIILPLSLMVAFNGMALAETAHVIFVVLWNVKLALHE